MSNRKTTKPWEDDEGNLLPTAALKIVSQNWPKETWDAYLKTIECPQREVILNNYNRVMLKEDARSALRNYQAEEANEEGGALYLTPAAIRKVLIHLNYRQRRMVELVYLKGMKIKDAAKKLGITPRPAGRTLMRARLRMKQELMNRIEARASSRRTVELQ